MLKKSALMILLTLMVFGSAVGGDLYKVTVSQKSDFQTLSSLGIDPVVRLRDGFLVLTTEQSTVLLKNSGLEYQLVAANIDRSQLAVDGRLDRENADRYPLLYEEDNLRLYRVDAAVLAELPELAQLFPVANRTAKIEYKEPSALPDIQTALTMDLETLIALIRQDSLESYTERLQAFYRRAAGTDSNYAARDWLYNKFLSFGYDSVLLDDFTASLSGVPGNCYNVLAVKPGSLYPGQHIIVGAHFDAVPASPGADDNGSGTAGVLEIARILKDLDTRMTIIFALFDAEEYGLYGSYHYVAEAEARGDSIIYMLNMDMIGHYENTNLAKLYYGDDDSYSQLWQNLADSLVGIYGVLTGSSSGSDHYPFAQKGYDVTFVIEYIFSNVYHTSNDITDSMSFEYMTKLVKASLATVYVVNDTYVPQPVLVVDYPQGVPFFLTPEATNSFEVTVTGLFEGTPVSGSGLLHFAVDGGAYQTAPLVELGGNLYQATLPALDCHSRCLFYISIEESSGGTFYNPDPDYPFEAVSETDEIIVFEDDFETDKGWTVINAAVDGAWERGVPVGGGLRGDPPSDFDGSGQCYLTDNVAGNSDIDDGSTSLISPAIALGNENARVGFALWYSNDFGSEPNSDVLYIYISNDDGSNWTFVKQVGPVEQASGGWFVHSFWVNDFVTSSNQMKIAFEASDYGNGSVVEAAVDAVKIASYECNPIQSCCVGSTGNADCSEIEEPDISDITRLIDYLYLSHTALCCMEEADADASGGEPDISDITRLIDHLYLTQQPLPICP